MSSFQDALGAIEGVEGWLSEDQARRLFDAASRVPAGGRIVEIGSYHGRSAIVLRRAALAEAEVIAIDPHAGNDRGPQQIAGSDAAGAADHAAFQENLRRAGLLDGVRHLRLGSEEALVQLQGGVDLLYVDGAHRYRPARSDLMHWGARVVPSGRLLVHDALSSVGVTRALLRELLFSNQFVYRGRSRSLAEYERAPMRLRGGARVVNCLRQLTELPWFARNVLIKLLVVAGFRRAAERLGLPPGDEWPY